MSVADRQLMYERLRLQELTGTFMCYTYTPFVFTKVHVLYIHTFCF